MSETNNQREIAERIRSSNRAARHNRGSKYTITSQTERRLQEYVRQRSP